MHMLKEYRTYSSKGDATLSAHTISCQTMLHNSIAKRRHEKIGSMGAVGHALCGKVEGGRSRTIGLKRPTDQQSVGLRENSSSG